jgi:sirohydrochlorin ferrochelatase
LTVHKNKTALVLAAHGDRGSACRNAVLRRHMEALSALGICGKADAGVLNGEPLLQDVLRDAASEGVEQLLVYPFFMSGGYFVKKVLPERIALAKIAQPVTILAPLGLDPRLPRLLIRRSLDTAKEAGFVARTARLLIVGHGSKFGRASAEATKEAAAAVSASGAFGKVVTAFLEEPPFLFDALNSEQTPTVVAGFFSGEGMHGHDDVPAAIARISAPCAYTRPIGADPEVAVLIEQAVEEFFGACAAPNS